MYMLRSWTKPKRKRKSIKHLPLAFRVPCSLFIERNYVHRPFSFIIGNANMSNNVERQNIIVLQHFKMSDHELVCSRELTVNNVSKL